MATTPQIPNGISKTNMELTNILPVVGINLGNSYASIAISIKVGDLFMLVVYFKISVDQKLQEGQTECIANEDGERQIACAVSFQGEEMVRPCRLVPMDNVADLKS